MFVTVALTVYQSRKDSWENTSLEDSVDFAFSVKKKKNDLNGQRQALSVNACLHFISFEKKNRGTNGNWRENIKKKQYGNLRRYMWNVRCVGVF